MTSDSIRPLFDAEARALLDFGKQSRTGAGFGWLNDDGELTPSQGVQLWITGRMTHCFALGHLLGDADGLPLAAHGVAALLDGPLHAVDRDAWFSRVEIDGTPADGALVSYDHSFVILAAASALLAGVPRADELLDAALATFERLWWDEGLGMVVDARDPHTLTTDPYRGANANMHTVEALLAAYAATRETLHLKRAARITRRIAEAFTSHSFRLPEHFDESWTAQLDYNRDIPADAFRPFGSTIGHWLEWSRLMVQLRTACESEGIETPASLAVIPQHMYRRALQEGWGPDGEPGFVYTVDFDGRPVVHQRMYWVLCEAIGAAETLRHVTADPSYDLDVNGFWDWARTYLIERPGQWREELDATNQPACGTWSGKPDIYHALQAMLIGALPVTPSFATGLMAARTS
ncbi:MULTISPECIES: AGE family epimerase/isomerase [unclassified Actinomyces]|uniref:AGE family epimerase/isomerase n=1 Tax=unclassified Actinomyces TaxID=2609248 RepID=UPI0020175119|nr:MULTISPECIES: AGE family epimerase/isomerase [unclassified Actinomyces]MCL3778133.1 AGE family epimerase/isomerase [Actinomyces sp. AC-20-1]MCL3789410.1 AGE family epimerase/isomerase [Actinomyces sp. 187325]MCL3791733.1 AGE family epimerase/isomerase [Actinomyces sp. 186855]MCL3794385.1 AGE family epimerase/isomerase [Actinomyces sp. 217892]